MSEIKDKVVSLEILKVAYDELKEETGQLSEEIADLKAGEVNDEAIASAVENYLTEHPVDVEIPDQLPNPKSLTINLGSDMYTYDGNSAVTITIEDGSEVSY